MFTLAKLSVGTAPFSTALLLVGLFNYLVLELGTGTLKKLHPKVGTLTLADNVVRKALSRVSICELTRLEAQSLQSGVLTSDNNG